ncbi:MAG: PaaI family thioesterase [Promethearchaeota archaeon]|nr:MAG: PaaI family thioesterase [Candidatus Lokiarchaeota archaeon]
MVYTAKELKDYMLKYPPIPNYYSGNCFGCVNPVGLKLKFWILDGIVFTSYIIPEKYSGFQGLGHGGIIATLLDETSAWTTYVNIKKFGVTQNFMLNYIKPVFIDTEIIVEGKIASDEKTHIIVHAHIKNLNDQILVESNSTWSLPDLKTLAKLFNKELEELEEIHNTFFNPINKFFEKKK